MVLSGATVEPGKNHQIMNAPATHSPNIVPLAVVPKPKPQQHKQRLRVIEYKNHTGGISFRVDGYKPDGARVAAMT
jgi:hypothetical protein